MKNLYNLSMLAFGKVDAVINNATIAALGQVKDLLIQEWDRSYHVNLRGPVLMAKTFLPDMIERNHGVFACVSSTGTAFAELAKGYEKDRAKLEENLRHVYSWRDEVNGLEKVIRTAS